MALVVPQLCVSHQSRPLDIHNTGVAHLYRLLPTWSSTERLVVASDYCTVPPQDPASSSLSIGGCVCCLPCAICDAGSPLCDIEDEVVELIVADSVEGTGCSTSQLSIHNILPHFRTFLILHLPETPHETLPLQTNQTSTSTCYPSQPCWSRLLYTTIAMSSADAQIAFQRGGAYEPVEAQDKFAQQFDLSRPEQAMSSYQK